MNVSSFRQELWRRENKNCTRLGFGDPGKAAILLFHVVHPMHWTQTCFFAWHRAEQHSRNPACHPQRTTPPPQILSPVMTVQDLRFEDDRYLMEMELDAWPLKVFFWLWPLPWQQLAMGGGSLLAFFLPWSFNPSSAWKRGLIYFAQNS